MNVIHIAAEEDAVLINQVAEMLGKGQNNLSVPLIDGLGNSYLGCHSSAWVEQDYVAFSKREGFSSFCSQEQLEALDRIYESVFHYSNTYVATEQWSKKLSELGLSAIHE